MTVAGKPAVVLLSGGLDSTTVLAIAQSEGYAVHGLSFRYGQRHEHELEAADRSPAPQRLPATSPSTSTCGRSADRR